MRRTTGRVLMGAAVAVLLVTGCTGVPKGKPEAAKSEGQYAETLSESFRKIERESFEFTSTVTIDRDRIKSEGAYDAEREQGDLRVKFAGQKMQVRVLGEDMYLQMAPQQWLHIDLRKLPVGNSFADAGNPVGNADLLLAASDDVKEVEDGRYEGTLDLRAYLKKHADPEDREKYEKGLGKLGEDAERVPFAATVDEDGRLTSLTTTMNLEIRGEERTVVHESRYSDFGTRVDVRKPPAEQTQEAPATIYSR